MVSTLEPVTAPPIKQPNESCNYHFPVVLFIIFYKVVLTFESVDEILKCDHSNESCLAVLPCGAVYHALQGGSKV